MEEVSEWARENSCKVVMCNNDEQFTRMLRLLFDKVKTDSRNGIKKRSKSLDMNNSVLKNRLLASLQWLDGVDSTDKKKSLYLNFKNLYGIAQTNSHALKALKWDYRSLQLFESAMNMPFNKKEVIEL
eukprot:TRINITY_DN2304_c0_g2_i3.p1 TRINITY_DN2304_c0_g2~~TRINITY_DN2304_c0_g2_i3.p1  ORF type:complete len:128 (+),score=24.36 TRINITY_DN2304_c0_g2_i3:197-580(+)